MGNKSDKKQGPPVLTEKELTVLKSTTTLTVPEIKEWHAGFIRDCPTGRIDRAQFARIYKTFYPDGNTDNYCKYAFDTFDKNKDGVIDFEEFVFALVASGNKDPKIRLAAAFDLYDINNDHQIDQKELITVIKAMYDLRGETNREGDRDPEKCAADILKRLDLDGNKKLSKEEFVYGCETDSSLREILAPSRRIR